MLLNLYDYYYDCILIFISIIVLVLKLQKYVESICIWIGIFEKEGEGVDLEDEVQLRGLFRFFILV